METKEINKYVKAFFLDAEEDGLPFGATEIFIRTDLAEETIEMLEDTLQAFGFDCMDGEEDENGEVYATLENDPHRWHYWARIGVIK